MANFRVEENGVVFPLFEDFKRELVEEGKLQFGDEFDIDSETSTGQIFEVFLYMFENLSKQMQSIYSQMWLYNKRGAILSAYAGNYGIERIQGKKAYGELKIIGVPNYILSKGFQVRSKQGKLYETVSNIMLDNDGIGIVQIRALEIGDEYNTSIGLVKIKATGNENIYEVSNITPVSNGTYLESDEDLRERIMKLFETKNGADVNGITKAMLELSQVSECKVLENSTNEYDNETGLNPGEIMVIIKGLADQEVAEKLFNTKSAGIVTVGNTEFNVVSISQQNIKIKLQVAKQVKYYVKVSNIVSKNNQDTVSIDEIKNNILNKSKLFKLGDYINYEKLLSAVYEIDKQKEATVEISKDKVTWLKEDITLTNLEYSYLDIEDIQVV